MYKLVHAEIRYGLKPYPLGSPYVPDAIEGVERAYQLSATLRDLPYDQGGTWGRRELAVSVHVFESVCYIHLHCDGYSILYAHEPEREVIP